MEEQDMRRVQYRRDATGITEDVILDAALEISMHEAAKKVAHFVSICDETYPTFILFIKAEWEFNHPEYVGAGIEGLATDEDDVDEELALALQMSLIDAETENESFVC